MFQAGPDLDMWRLLGSLCVEVHFRPENVFALLVVVFRQ